MAILVDTNILLLRSQIATFSWGGPRELPSASSRLLWRFPLLGVFLHKFGDVFLPGLLLSEARKGRHSLAHGESRG